MRHPRPLKPARHHPSDGRGAGHASRRRGTGFARPPASSPCPPCAARRERG